MLLTVNFASQGPRWPLPEKKIKIFPSSYFLQDKEKLILMSLKWGSLILTAVRVNEFCNLQIDKFCSLLLEVP